MTTQTLPGCAKCVYRPMEHAVGMSLPTSRQDGCNRVLGGLTLAGNSMRDGLAVEAYVYAYGGGYGIGGVPMKSGGKGYANYELPVHRDAKIFQLSQTNANR